MKRNYLIVCLTLFIWGSLYVAGKYAFVSIPPVTVLLFRNLIGIVPLGCLAWKSGWKKVEKKHIKVFVLFGLFGYTLAVGFQLHSSSFIPDFYLSVLRN